MMRGRDEMSGFLFRHVALAGHIPTRHPLRKVRQVFNEAIARIDAEFEALYIDCGS